MAFYCYILRCADGRYYTGHTDDLNRRMAQHEAGGFCDFTARRKPVELVWSDYFETRLEALEAERRIKGWGRGKKEALIACDWALISQLAASSGTRPSTSSGRTVEGAAAEPQKPVRAEPVEARVKPATKNPVRAELVEARATSAPLAR